MIIVMETGAESDEVEAVISRIETLGYTSHPIRGVLRTVIGAVGDERGKAELQALEAMPGVERVWSRPTSSRARGLTACAAGPSSPAPVPTPSRAWERRA
jgi:hypothetical protein